MTDFYCYVVNGVIERYNIQKPKAHGNKAYGENATDAELAADGYFPIVGEAPAYDSATERLEGPVYAVGEGVVVQGYEVVAKVISVSEYTDAVQAHLDAKAKEKNYDNIVSACSYAGAANPFQAEGIKFVEWRGAVWAKCYEIMALVQQGQRAAPTITELITELPDLVL